VNWPSARLIRDKLFELARYGAIGVAVYLLASQFVRHSSGPKAGTAAAAFDLPLADRDGRVSLAAQRGKPVLMEVFASWCGACKRSSPRLVDAFHAHQGEDVTFLAVSVDQDASAAARINTVRCKVLSPAWTNAKHHRRLKPQQIAVIAFSFANAAFRRN